LLVSRAQLVEYIKGKGKGKGKGKAFRAHSVKACEGTRCPAALNLCNGDEW